MADLAVNVTDISLQHVKIFTNSSELAASWDNFPVLIPIYNACLYHATMHSHCSINTFLTFNLLERRSSYFQYQCIEG